MNRKFLLLMLITLCANICVAQGDANELSLEESYKSLQEQQTRLENDVRRLNREASDASRKLSTLKEDNKALYSQIDSLQEVCNKLNNKQVSDKSEMDGKLKLASDTIRSNQATTNATLKSHSIWGSCLAIVIVLILVVMAYCLLKRINKGSTSIDKIGKAQDALQEAQKKLQEDSVQLDNKLLELLEKQISSASPPATSSSEVDHSLALKVADEIVRIEMNLSRMDASIKGFKQLSKAVERIKNNFLANGYEIVDMLGKPYNEGMRVTANFVPDDTLAVGEQKITSITKPQVNYNGKMIQAAQITVSQNI